MAWCKAGGPTPISLDRTTYNMLDRSHWERAPGQPANSLNTIIMFPRVLERGAESAGLLASQESRFQPAKILADLFPVALCVLSSLLVRPQYIWKNGPLAELHCGKSLVKIKFHLSRLLMNTNLAKPILITSNAS